MTRLMAEVRSSMEDVLSMLSITGVRCPCSRPSLSLGCRGSGAVSGPGLDCDRPATVDHWDELDTNVTKTYEAVDAQKDDESLSVEHLLSVHDQGVADLRAAVSGMTGEMLRSRPIPGKWSTFEVVCHLTDCEQFCADRMKRFLGGVVAGSVRTVRSAERT